MGKILRILTDKSNVETIPQELKNEIRRDNMVNEIFNNLNNGTVPMAVLFGETFSGKTTVLKQFYDKFSDTTAAYFVQEDFYKDTTVSILEDYCKQLLPFTSLKVRSKISESAIEDFNVQQLTDAFGKIYTDLCSQVKKSEKKFFIVLDGVDKLEEDVKSEIMKLLPVGDKNGVFVIISSVQSTFSSLNSKYNFIPVTIPYFSIAETQYILSNLVESKILIERIHNFCNGLPPYIHELSVKLMQDSSVSADEIFESLPENFEKHLDNLWNKVEEYDDDLKELISVIIFSPDAINFQDIVKLIELEALRLSQYVLEMEFLKEENDMVICLPLYELFLKDKLQSYKTRATQLLIKYYEVNKELDPRMVSVLSSLYKETGNYEKLKKIMSLETLYQNLLQLKEFTTMKNNLKLLENMSYQEKDWATYIGSIFPGGILSDINRTSPTVEEDIKTLLRLKEYQEALNIAYQCTLDDDRCYSLSLVCKSLKIDNQEVSSHILGQVKKIIRQKDFFKNATEDRVDKLINISTNLFPIDMDLSLEIIRGIAESKNEKSSDDRLMDYMLLKLFLKLDDDDTIQSDFEALTPNIEKTDIKDFLSIATTSNVKTFDEIKVKVDSITDISAKMFYLINWCVNNEENEDLHKVSSHALELFSGSVTHSLTIRDLRYLVEAIINVSDSKELNLLLKKVEEVRVNLLDNPLEEYIKLELGIGKIEKKLNNENFQDRYLALIIYTEDTLINLDDKSLAFIYLLRNHEIFVGEADRKLYSELEENFKSSFSLLIQNSANQDEVLGRIFLELGKIDFNLALELYKQVNTEKNRFRIYQKMVKGYLSKNDFEFKLIEEIFRNFSDKGFQDFLIFSISKELSSGKVRASEIDLKKLYSAVLKITTLNTKILCLSFLWMQENIQEGLKEEIFNNVSQSIDSIEYIYMKRKIIHYVIQNISKSSLAEASLLYKKYMGDTQTSFNDERLNSINKNLILLSIKTLPEISKSADPTFFVKTICSYIENCNDLIDKAFLYNELGLKLHSIERIDLLNIFKRTYVNMIAKDWKDNSTFFEIMNTSSTLLFIESESMFLEMVRKINYIEYKETAVINVIKYLATGKSSNDIVDFSNLALPTNINSIKSIIELTQEFESDVGVALSTEILSQALETSVKRNEYTIREGEIINVFDAMSKTINEKLPDSKNIQHDGYKIICMSHFAKFRGLKLTNKKVERVLPVFEELYQKAQEIPNLSDKIFVYCYLADHSFNSDLAFAANILKEAEEILKSLNNINDKINKTEQIAQSYYAIGNKRAAEHLLKTIFEIAKAEKRNQYSTYSENLEAAIELAHKINPELAQTLCKNIDSPHEEEELNNTLQALNFHMNPSKIKGEETVQEESMRNFFYKTIKSLNSGRGSIQDKNLPIESLSRLSRPSVDNIFLGLTWYVENTNLSNRSANISSLSEEFLKIMEIIQFVSNLDSFVITTSNLTKPVKNLYSLMSEDNSTTFRIGQGDDALNYVLSWINENAKDSLVIYDPYFSHEELFIFMEIHLKENISVISSWGEIEKEKLEETFKVKWLEICDQSPPSISYTIFSAKNKQTHMHDRFVLGDEMGIKIGSSFNGFNKNDFSIEILDKDQVEVFKNQFVLPSLINPPTSYNNQRIKTLRFQM